MELDENLDNLAQEMNRHDVIADELRQRHLITVVQYRRVISKTGRYQANKYLLQLITSEPPAYLDGLKDALIKTKQEEFLDYLP